MSKHEKNDKIVKYRKPIQINIGNIIFGIIFLYIAICTVHYLMTDRVSSYEVQMGTIAQNDTYTGFAVREETIVYSKRDGYINYFSKDGSKVGKKSLVYSLDDSGNLFSVDKTSDDGTLFDDEDYAVLNESLLNYCYTSQSFYDVYGFKDTLKGDMIECLTLENGVADKSKLNMGQVSNLALYYAQLPGVVVYSVDGYEDVTVDSFQPSMMDKTNYTSASLKLREKVSADEPVYKLITSENWQLIVPIDKETAKKVQDETYINITFKEDGNTSWAQSSVKAVDGNDYLILSFNNSMIRYAQSRFIEIEMTVDELTGLKIPNTAIVEKEFLIVPTEYLTKGGNSSSLGVMKQVADEKTKTVSAEFVAVNVYQTDDEVAYIHSQNISKGDVIYLPESSKTYTLEDTENLQGVYNVNKGYAVFKKIEILNANENYSIVKQGSSYGISVYDHIALDGSNIDEGDMIDE